MFTCYRGFEQCPAFIVIEACFAVLYCSYINRHIVYILELLIEIVEPA